eukprot:4210511-Pyramimonas_sp.AAC.1
MDTWTTVLVSGRGPDQVSVGGAPDGQHRECPPGEARPHRRRRQLRGHPPGSTLGGGARDPRGERLHEGHHRGGARQVQARAHRLERGQRRAPARLSKVRVRGNLLRASRWTTRIWVSLRGHGAGGGWGLIGGGGAVLVPAGPLPREDRVAQRCRLHGVGLSGVGRDRWRRAGLGGEARRRGVAQDVGEGVREVDQVCIVL